jgi:hypothetical protein|tara:strand:+ start:280 stop:546 length:267 start_codon:yes stop_codon:yes gene_type:complete
MNTLERETKVEMRFVDDRELPPIIIKANEDDLPVVIINTYHRIWISLKRRTIAGIIHDMQDKMDMILTGYLEEQRKFEKEDREYEDNF